MVTSHSHLDFEILQSAFFEPGQVIAMGPRAYMEIVADIEHADGVIFLGRVKDDGPRCGPGVLLVYFTYYLRLPTVDMVDHEATIAAIDAMDAERTQEMSRLVCQEIHRSSLAAGICFNPNVTFFEH
jgi:hypothetical protein